jgi:hypothetical protein
MAEQPDQTQKIGNPMKTGFKKNHLSLVISNKEGELKNDIGDFQDLRTCISPAPRRLSWFLLLILGLWTVAVVALAENEFRYRYVMLNKDLLQPGIIFFNPSEIYNNG